MCNILQISYTNCDKQPLCLLKEDSKQQSSSRCQLFLIELYCQLYKYALCGWQTYIFSTVDIYAQCGSSIQPPRQLYIVTTVSIYELCDELLLNKIGRKRVKKGCIKNRRNSLGFLIRNRSLTKRRTNKIPAKVPCSIYDASPNRFHAEAKHATVLRITASQYAASRITSACSSSSRYSSYRRCGSVRHAYRELLVRHEAFAPCCRIA